ncbi:MAG: TadE family protein [Thiohalomonadales bacterium]|nr:TadE family protein [Thiohalomonadales bacterium]
MNRQIRQSGAAMVEFAIILPVMLILAFGITELGRAIYQQNTLDKAMASGVRYMTRAWQAVASDCSQGTGWSAATANAAKLVAYGSQNGGDPLLPDLDPTDVTFTVAGKVVPESGDTACVVTGIAKVPFDSVFGSTIIPFLDIGPITLNAKSEERYHGE